MDSCNAEEPERLLHAAGEIARGPGDVAGSGQSQETEGQIAESGHDLGAVSFADLGPIFVKSDVPDMMDFVLDGPVATNEVEDGLGAVSPGGETANAIDHLATDRLALKVGGVARHPEDGLSVGHLDVIGQKVGRGECASLNSTVAFVQGRYGLLRGEKHPSRRWRCLPGGWFGCLWR